MKKKILKITALLFVLLFICTALSRTVYQIMLPTVKLESVTKGTLSEKTDYLAEVDFVNTEDVSTDVTWTVLMLEVKKGDEVEAGQTLFIIDTEESDLEREQLSLNVKIAKEQVLSLTGNAKAQAEINLKRAEQALSKHDEIYPKDGVVKAIKAGRVVEINCVSNESVSGTVMRIETNESRIGLSFDMSADSALQIKEGSPVQFSIFSSADSTVPAPARIDEVTANDFGGATATVFVKPAKKVELDSKAKVTFKRESEFYPTLVPLSSVQMMGAENIIYVVKNEQGMFGEKLTVEAVNVQILDKSNRYAAVDIKLDKDAKVVTYASKAISNGSDVRLAEQVGK